MERVSSLDASFLAIEDAVNHMHIGSIGIFEGPAPTYRDLCELIASKLVLVPRYRQRVRTAPASIGRPVWIDVPGFDLERHVRRIVLPWPGGIAELRTLVGRLMSQQLDRGQPLWENWMVEGLGAGQWAFVTKVHHCMVDGIAGSDLLAVVLDRERDPEPAPLDEWRPQPEPSAADLALHSFRGLAGVPVTWVRGAGEVLRHPDTMLARSRDVAVGLGRLGGLVRPAPPSTLTGPIGHDRRWDCVRATLAEIKEVRSALGGTVNDVVLAAVTQGFRSLLTARGEPLAGRVVRSLVPVSLRTPDARGLFDNRVTAVFADLPVGIDDPIERLAAVRNQMASLKVSHEADAAEAITDFVGFGPPILTALLTRVAVHRQRSVETVTTNVPGPQIPLYALGRRMLEAYPYVPISGTIQTGVAIWSYDGGLHFGVTGDRDGVPDIAVLCTGITDGLEELRHAARGTGGQELRQS